MDDGNSTTGERPYRKGYAPLEVRRSLAYVVIAWVFGAPFFAITTGVPFTSLLTRYLKADDFTYSLIMAAGPAAMLFLFLGSYVAERTGRAKRNFLIFVSLQRSSWLIVAAVALWSHSPGPPAALWIVGLVAFTSQALSNYGGAGWSAWISDIVPSSVAGGYFGTRARLGMLSMITVSTGGVYLLQQAQGSGAAYAVVFAVAAVLGTTDILLFTSVPEVPRGGGAKLPTLKDILVTPWRNALFRSYVTYTAASWIAYMMLSSFVWRFCFDPPSAHGLGMGVLRTHILLSILPVSLMAWVAPAWGQAIDRFGPRPVLALSAICIVVVPSIWAFVHPSAVWTVWLAAVATGLTWPGIEQVNFYMTMKGFPDVGRTAYVAGFQFVMGTATVAGTALGGVCATFWQRHMHDFPFIPAWASHYQPLFLTSILLRLAALVLLFPRVPLQGKGSCRAVAASIIEELGAPIRRMRG